VPGWLFAPFAAALYLSDAANVRPTSNCLDRGGARLPFARHRPRTREIVTALVRHLHAFVHEVHLSKAEWLAGIQFLTAFGQKCDDRRQEFILLSDTLGVSALKDQINHRHAPGSTEHTLLGPFHRRGAPPLPFGANLAEGLPGEPVWVRGRVQAAGRVPLPGAHLDVWQADAEGYYDLQRPDLNGYALRGQFEADEQGCFYFRTIRPASYPIPNDGPVGHLLRALGRHPYRPAHIHFIISAQGYQTLTTELFVAGDPYLGSDAVFGVLDSLVVPFVRHSEPEPDVPAEMPLPFWTVDYDFVLEPA
jgi:hydroxyquinol 1,2-dioxygenase